MVIKIIKGKELDIKPNEIRYRLLSPAKVDVVGRKKITDGVSIMVSCPKGKVKKKRCTVGTEAQALRFDRSKFTPEKAAKWIDKHWEK